MRTKISGICDAVLEAGWLLALAIIPLFFNVYSSRVFEPDKLAILRSIATLMALAIVARYADERLAGRTVGSGPSTTRVGWRAPLVLPAMILAGVYLLSTAFSVVPRISLWGSYQRLQGTYSLLSYMVIFAALLTTLRRREQLDRLVTVVILTSLPISLYGMLQHYQLDPLPWGGDTTFRVASNMGNPIFVAAYLIMVLPLCLARVVQLVTGGPAGEGRRARVLLGAGVAVVLLAEVAGWALLGFGAGLAISAAGVVGLALVGVAARKPLARYLLLGAHLLALSAQAVCLFFTQSRGPWLGLAAGLALFLLLYLLAVGRRRLALLVTVGGLALAAFIVWLNVPNSPFAPLREVPYVGRLGQLLETEGGTGKVRLLIWEGAAEMVASDPARALIGYGPEAMYVAFTPFYPAELGHYEARNRSPDRAHNETFDALITTGVLGLAAHLLLFGSVFYYGMRWMGLLATPGRRRAFLLCMAAGGVLGTALPVLWDGSWRYIGVGQPLGMLAGVAAYAAGLSVEAVASGRSAGGSSERRGPAEALLIAALVAGIAAHFLEINLGIAIAATRTYFWAYAGLLVVLGQGWLPTAEEATEALPAAIVAAPRAARRRGARRQPTRRRSPLVERLGAHPVTAPALLAGLVLAVMVWDYTTNPLGSTNPGAVLVQSLTSLAAVGRPDVESLGMVGLFLSTFAAGGLLCVAGAAARSGERRSAAWWCGAGGLFVAIAAGLGMAYATLHARALTQISQPADLLTGLIVMVVAVGLALTAFLWPRASGSPAWGHLATPIAAAAALVGVLLFVNVRNVRMVRADVVYKEGYRYDSAQSWSEAARLYEEAHLMEPDQDHYLLFLGRALLEVAAGEKDAAAQDAAYEEALLALEEAQGLNPLNTDHTANIARLYRRWAFDTDDPTLAHDMRLQALATYERAVALSPNSAPLRNEWALTYMDLGDLDGAEDKYTESLAIDDEYAQTYLLVGELRKARGDWRGAVEAYTRATELDATSLQAWAALGVAYSNLEEWQNAIHAYQRGLEVNYKVPPLWGYLGDAYSRLGDAEAAVDAYQRAVALDDGFVAAWRALADHLVHLQRWADAEQALTKLLNLSPDDYTAHRALAQLYLGTGRPAEALPHAERALGLAPEAERAALQALLAEASNAAGKDTPHP
ncbi:MAG: tetratricopeptide repeat protein [Chloroflexi bacterium]|nr:tetratricopeptide repeat protein [Chloroflexota bacterium]